MTPAAKGLLFKADSTKFNLLYSLIIFSESVHPCAWKWELHRGIVPPEEDYFDYLPVEAALCPVSRQLLTLTREDAAKFQFRDFKVYGKTPGASAGLGY